MTSQLIKPRPMWFSCLASPLLFSKIRMGFLGAIVSLFVMLPNSAEAVAIDGRAQATLGRCGLNLAKIAKTRLGEHAKCLSDAGRGRLLPGQTAQECLTADNRGKLVRAEIKTLKIVTALEASPSGANEIVAASIASNAGAGGFAAIAFDQLTADVVGPDLAEIVPSGPESRAIASCQKTLFKQLGKSASGRLKNFGKCVKTSLKSGVETGAGLSADCASTLGRDEGEWVSLFEEGLAKRCEAKGVPASSTVEGVCGEDNFARCIESRVSCRLCRLASEIFSLDADCELLDDGADNGSCCSDSDGDSFCDDSDSCPNIPNPDQYDFDGDDIGNPCDPDADGDGVPDAEEALLGLDPTSRDSDGDGIRDGFDPHPTDPAIATDPNALYLESGTVVPAAGLDPTLSSATGSPYVLIQLDPDADTNGIGQLQGNYGVSFLTPIPENTWYARVPAAALGALASEPSVRAILAIPEELLFSTELRLHGILPDRLNEAGRVPLSVTFMPDVDMQAVLASLAAAFAVELGELEVDGFDGNLAAPVSVLISWLESPAGLREALPGVQFVEPTRATPIDLGTQDRDQLRIDVNPGNRPVLQTGAGVVVAQFEGYLPSLSNPSLAGDVSLGGSGARSKHATHVAGIITADGSCSGCLPQAEGVAPDAKVVAYRALNGDDPTNYRDATINHGARISNNSWGESSTTAGKYTDYARKLDREVRGTGKGIPLSVVSAVGNNRRKVVVADACSDQTVGKKPKCQLIGTTAADGEAWECIGPPATAKNSIGVGNLNGAGLCTNSTSAHGPTADGRLKPEVSAPGTRVVSTLPAGDEDEAGNINIAGDCTGSGGACGTCLNEALQCDTVGRSIAQASDFPGFGSKTGTSMAAPNVAGSLALLYEAWDEFGLTGIRGNQPFPSTMKALLAQTARDLHNDGTSGELVRSSGSSGPVFGDGPSYRNGFGMVDVRAAMDVLEAQADGVMLVHESNSLRTYSEFEDFPFAVQGSEVGKDFRVTIAWDDIPAAKGASKTLVHDFDLELIAPNGWVYSPFVLNPGRPAADPVCTIDTNEACAAVAGPCEAVSCRADGSAVRDDLNNIEQVYVPWVRSDQIGTWTARVRMNFLDIYVLSNFRDANFSIVIPMDQTLSCGSEVRQHVVMTKDLGPCGAGEPGLILREGATLDCAGYTLQGSGIGANGVGIQLDEELSNENFEIRNCTVRDFGVGINGTNVEQATIEENTFVGNGVHVAISGADEVVIAQNNFRESALAGVQISGTRSEVSNNLFTGNALRAVRHSGAAIVADSKNVFADAASDLVVASNEITANRIGIKVLGYQSTIENNVICRSEQTGILHRSVGTYGGALIQNNRVCGLDGDTTTKDITCLRSLGPTCYPSAVDPLSDGNTCQNHYLWADASVASGCSSNLCGSGGPCSVSLLDEAIQGNLLAGWTAQAVPDFVVAGEFPGQLPSGSPPGWADWVMVGTPLVIEDLSSGELASFSLSPELLQQALVLSQSVTLRLNPQSNTFSEQVASVARVDGGGLQVSISEPGTYAVFAPACDRVVQAPDVGGPPMDAISVGSNETVCLEPSGMYPGLEVSLLGSAGTLECQGATLQGGNTCVEVDGIGNTVRGCNLDACSTSILLAGTAIAARVEGVESKFANVGLAVVNGEDALVSGSVFCDSLAEDVSLLGVSPTFLANVCDGSECETICGNEMGN